MAKGHAQNKSNMKCVEWLEKEVSEPDLSNMGNKGKIYLWVLCYKKRYSEGVHTNENTYNRWRSFCIHCKDYVYPYKITMSNESDESKWPDTYRELITRFNTWFDVVRGRIEMMLAQDYFIFGKNPNLEILKRRFRNNWGENPNRTEVKVNNNSDTKDTTLEIVIGGDDEAEVQS